MGPKPIRVLSDFFKGEAQTSAISVVLLVVGPLISGAWFAVWAALTGSSGPWIALAGLAGFLLVLLLILAYNDYGYRRPSRRRFEAAYL